MRNVFTSLAIFAGVVLLVEGLVLYELLAWTEPQLTSRALFIAHMTDVTLYTGMMFGGVALLIFGLRRGL